MIRRRAQFYVIIGDWTNALLDYEALVKVNMHDVQLHTLVGFCHFQLNACKEAIASLSTAISITPLDVDLYIARSRALLNSNRHREAKSA